MRMKEKYLNNQYNTLGLEFIEVFLIALNAATFFK